MESDKVMFKFFNEFIFLDLFEVGNDVKVNDLRKYIINRFCKTITHSRIVTTLSLIDDVILKLHVKNLEGIQDDMYSVRENVMYMLSFEKFVIENPVGDKNEKSVFFRKFPQNRDYIQTFCSDRRNPFHFACRQWYLYNNPQCNMV